MPYPDTIEPVRQRVAIPGDRRELEVRLADGPSDVMRCRHLIAQVYNHHFGVVFSRYNIDLAAKIEPYPHRYAMGFVDGIHVATCGIYDDRTYVQKFGLVEDQEVMSTLARLDGPPSPSRWALREYTKLVVHPDWHHYGIGRLFFGMTHSADFLRGDATDPILLLACARRSMFDGMYRRMEFQTHPIKDFPIYKVHERYASPADPMDSRVIRPEHDIPVQWFGLSLPATMPLSKGVARP